MGTAQTEGPQQSHYPQTRINHLTLTRNMMASKAAMKFCQINPEQHQKLQEVIRGVQAGGQQHHHHQQSQGADKHRQTWSSRMIFSSKARGEKKNQSVRPRVL